MPKKTASPKKQTPYHARKGDKIPAQVYMSPEEHAVIKAAAAVDKRPITQVLLLGGLEYARKKLPK